MIAGYKSSSKIGEVLLALRLLPQALSAIGKQKVGGVGYCGPPPALGQSRRCSRRCATDVRTQLPLVRTPTLVLHRRDDRAVRIEAGRHLAISIPGARFVELEGGDH